MAKLGEVEFAQIRQNQHTVDCRRTAETRDLILLKERQKLGCLEFAPEIDNEQTCAGNPLTEYLAPRTFCPSGIRGREVDVIGCQVMPEFGCNPMTERICVVVQHHLGLARGAGREIDKHGILGTRAQIRRHTDGFVGYGRRIEEFHRVARPVLEFAVDDHPCPQRRALLTDLVELRRILKVGDDHLELAGIYSVFEVFWRKQSRTRTYNGAEFDESYDENPPFGNAVKHNQNAVALVDIVF